MKKQFGEYYLGLDMGTDSVGYAVTDTNYNVLKFNRKGMWGARLFPSAETAAESRGHRAGRRRLERQRWRLRLLQELFAPEISKVDMGFFQRLQESNLQLEEKSANNKVKYSLFDSSYLSDREFYDKYPTIYHLKAAQLQGQPEAFDVRLLYLSLAHYFKARGHFLFDGLEASVDSGQGTDRRFQEIYEELIQRLQDEVEDLAIVDFADPKTVKKLLTDKDLTVTDKKKNLTTLFAAGSNKSVKAVAGLLAGAKEKLAEVFADDSLAELSSVSLRDGDLEDREAELAAALGDRYDVFLKFKAIYDLAVLDSIMAGSSSVAEAKVKVFNDHRKDLALLKDFLRDSHRELYREIFGVPQKAEANYSVYIGSCLDKKGKKAPLPKRVSQEEFCKYLVGKLKPLVDFNALEEITDGSAELDKLFHRIKDSTAFPKLRTKENGVIPVQLNEAELKKILTQAEKYLPFMAEKDSTGLTVSEKIRQIMTFRIPYYIGPLAGTELSRRAKRCWVVRTQEKIYPWNFDSVVNVSETAEKFIRNMTNKCTYLYSEDVLPKQSLLYTEFEVRNELNNLAVNGQRLPAETIQGIIDDLLLKSSRRVTKKGILRYLKSRNVVASDAETSCLSGIDDTLKSDMRSFRDFYGIFGQSYVDGHRDDVENIIRWITLFSGSPEMLMEKIKENYPQLSQETVRAIKKIHYDKWGRLSRTFLDSEKISWYDDSIGAPITLIEAMRRQPKNLMELLSQSCEYGFIEKVKAFNEAEEKPAKIDYSYIDGLYVSPAVKRSIWQTVQIVQEIKKITGHDPKKIFLEMPRGGEKGEKKRTLSRKTQLENFYKACKKDAPFFSSELVQELAGKDDAALRSKKLYLYFLQMGRDMYTGEKIEIGDLFAKSGQGYLYDLDHIFPRSKTKDDSLDNMVLVNYRVNREKSDEYPLPPEIRSRQRNFWQVLLKRGLISKKKFDRLTRSEELSTDELAGFINRQLVETRQSTKAAAQILALTCPDSRLVYSKAGNVSDFRQQFSFVKCRELNDLHHARDAYLNIVVGNVFDTQFTANPYALLKDRRFKYTLRPDALYRRTIQRGDRIAWEPGDEGTIKTVAKFMGRNNIQVTNMALENKGAIFGATIEKASDGKLLPIKQNLPPKRYGGYTGQSTAYFVLVESEGKRGALLRTIEAVPVHLVNRIQSDAAVLTEHLQTVLGLVNPRVILPKILLGSCLEIKGCPFYITGTTGEQLLGKLAAQLILNAQWEQYLKRLFKFLERYGQTKGNAVVTSYDGIASERNIALYSLLAEKLKEPVYENRPAISCKALAEKTEKFGTLSVEKQCVVLGEVLKLFQAKPLTADLRDIDGVKTAGKFQFSKKITGVKSAILHNYSITGLFEQEPVDLLTI